MFIVYKISNVINNKVYIGITKRTLQWRWSCHKSAARLGSDAKFHKAIRKYGESNWQLEILCECATDVEVSAAEDMHILANNSINEGYNSCRGGYQSTKLAGYKHTEQARHKITENANRRKVPVYQFDSQGTFLRKWDSALDAAIGVYGDVARKSNISKCANKYDYQEFVRIKGFPVYSFCKDGEEPPNERTPNTSPTLTVVSN